MKQNLQNEEEKKFGFLQSLTPSQIDLLHDEFDDYIILTDEEVNLQNCSVDIEFKDVYGNTVKI